MPPRAALCLVFLAGAACSTKTVIAVDPFPCSDAGISGCLPGLLDSLVGYWKLNDPAGSTTAHDSSSRGNDGTLVGLDAATVWIADPAAPNGAALSIEGKGHINVPVSTSIESITNQLTMSAWMYIDGTVNSFATPISRQIGTDFGQLYHMGVSSTLEPVAFITPGDPKTNQLARYAPNVTAPQKEWFHLACTYDGSTVYLYLNGKQVDSGAVSGTFIPENNPVILSGNANGADSAVSEIIPGRLAEVMLYRRALPASDILRLYQGVLLIMPRHTDAGGE